MRASRRRVAAISAAILALAAGGHATPIAAAQTPSPEELWDAYPLKPGSAQSEPADPAPTPTAAPTRAGSRPATPPVAAESGDDVTPAILIGFATLAFCVGFSMVAFRLRSRPWTRVRTAAGTVRRRVATTPPPPPVAAPVAPPAEEPLEGRFARSQPWPEDATEAWTCEVEFKPGYRKSTFRAMAAAPGEVRRRRRIVESGPIKWMLMGEPEPPTPEMAEAVRDVTAALTDQGWEHIGSGSRWYAQRFVWRQDDEPRPIAPQTGSAVDA
jgi:hypothetical protein